MKKLFLCALALTCISFHVMPQTPAKVMPIGGSQADNSYSIAADNSGNYYVTGLFSDTLQLPGQPDLISAGNADVFLIKYNSAGTVVWAKRAGSAGYDAGLAVSLLNGYLYVGGSYGNNATFESTTLTSLGAEDGFFAKYDLNGNLLWIKKAGSVSGQERIDKAVAVGNHIYACASLGSAPKYENTTTLNSYGGSDGYILKTDTAGNLLSHINFGGTSNDYAYLITKDDSSNLYVSGDFASTSIDFGSTPTKANNGLYDLYFAKYDTGLNDKWSVTAGSAGSEVVNRMTTDISGNSYIVGGFSNTVDFGGTSLTSNGGKDAFVAKYNNAGALVWVKKVGGTGSEELRTMLLHNNELVVSGYYDNTFTYDTATLTGIAGRDLMVFKFNTAGNLLWAKGYGGTGDETPNEMISGNNNNLLICGALFGATSFGPTLNATSKGNSYDGVIWEFALPTTPVGIEDAEKTDFGFNVFPNPGNGLFHITFKTEGNKTLSVFDMTGKQVLIENFDDDKHEFDLSWFKEGLYLLSVTSTEGKYSKLISVIR